MKFMTVTDKNNVKSVINLETINVISLIPEKDGSYSIVFNNRMIFVSKDEANRILAAVQNCFV